MAYGLKYINEFSSEDGSFYRLEIHELDYTGLTKQIVCSNEPVVIRRGAQNQNKYVAVLGSSLTINIVSDYSLQWKEFFTSNDKQFRVDFFKDGSIYWTGFIQTDIYQEPYVKGRFIIQVTANDGLANLKNINYDASAMTTVNDGYNITIDEWLRKNLGEMELFNYGGYDFYLYEAVDLELDNAPADTSPLTYLHILYNAKDGQPIYDILQGLVDSFACRIFQKNGAFYILPIDLIFAGEVTYRFRVDDAGGLDSTYTEVTQDVEKRFGRDLTWIKSDQTLEILSAFKDVSVSNSADVVPVIDETMGIEDWSNGTTLINWDTVGTFETVRQTSKFSKEGFLTYLKTEADQTGYIEIVKRIGYGEASSFTFEFEYFIKCTDYFEYDQTTDNFRIAFDFAVPYDDPTADEMEAAVSANDFVGNLSNTWVPFPGISGITRPFVSVSGQSSIGQWVKASYQVQILENDIWFSTGYSDRMYHNLYIRFRGLQLDASLSDVQETYFRNIKLTISDNTSYPVKSHTDSTTNLGEFTLNYSKSILFCNRQAVITDDKTFAQQFYNDANKLAFKNNDNEFIDPRGFSVLGSFTTTNYLSHLVSFRIARNYHLPSIKINGTMMGQLDLDSQVYDPNFPDKKFMVNFIEEYVKAGEKNVEIIEIFEPL